MPLDELKRACGEMLAQAGTTVKTKKGKDLVWAFYVGHYAGQDRTPPFVVLCLMSGRYEDLVHKGELE